jgi:hypothetical protein
MEPSALRHSVKDREGSLAGELRQELFALTSAEAPDAAQGDLGAFHDGSSASLADATRNEG